MVKLVCVICVQFLLYSDKFIVFGSSKSSWAEKEERRKCITKWRMNANGRSKSTCRNYLCAHVSYMCAEHAYIWYPILRMVDPKNGSHRFYILVFQKAEIKLYNLHKYLARPISIGAQAVLSLNFNFCSPRPHSTYICKSLRTFCRLTCSMYLSPTLYLSLSLTRCSKCEEKSLHLENSGCMPKFYTSALRLEYFGK